MPKKPNRPKLRQLASTQRALVALEPAVRSLQARDSTERWHVDANYRRRSKFYSSKRWEQTRITQLQNNPLCALCLAEGRLTAAVVVDHIVDLADGGHPTDYRNLRSLCWSCHSRITRAKQDGETPPETAPSKPPRFTIA